MLAAWIGHTKTLSQPAARYAPLAEPVLEDSSCSFRSVSCRTSRMGSTRSCSRSRIWRTSTPMSESKPRSASELSRLIPARSRMPAKGITGHYLGGEGSEDNLDMGTRYGWECWAYNRPVTLYKQPSLWSLLPSITVNHPGHVTLSSASTDGEAKAWRATQVPEVGSPRMCATAFIRSRWASPSPWATAFFSANTKLLRTA